VSERSCPLCWIGLLGRLFKVGDEAMQAVALEYDSWEAALWQLDNRVVRRLGKQFYSV
jgi:hypothetical protein